MSVLGIRILYEVLTISESKATLTGGRTDGQRDGISCVGVNSNVRASEISICNTSRCSGALHISSFFFCKTLISPKCGNMTISCNTNNDLR